MYIHFAVMDTSVCEVLLPEQDVLYYTLSVQLVYIHLYVLLMCINVRRMYYCNSHLLYRPTAVALVCHCYNGG